MNFQTSINLETFEKIGFSLINRYRRKKIIKYLANLDNTGKNFLYIVYKNGGNYITSERDLKRLFPNERLENILAYVSTVDTGSLIIASIPNKPTREKTEVDRKLKYL